ncbi:MAG TPA: MBG domain-containing protein [Tepidisphaeraceae bacterium]|nr:MBG domain-containing protein [Tepidisphaeraceae bacterium]
MFTGIFSPAARIGRFYRAERKLRAAIEALECRQLLSVGVADPTFGVDGVATATVSGPVSSYPVASVEQSDGKVIVEAVVDQDLIAARYCANGSLDTSFANDGVFRTAIAPGFVNFQSEDAVAVAPDGDIVLLATDNNLRTDVIELTPSGQLNTSFNGTGVLSFDFTGGDGEVALMNQVAVDSENRVVVAGFEFQNNPSDPGYQESDFALVRIDPNGSFDSTFNVQNTPTSLPQQTGGLAGAAGEEVVSEGPGEIEFDSLSLGSDNQIVLTGGYYDPNLGNILNAIAWLNPDGTLDTNFDTTGTETDILLGDQTTASPMHTAIDASDNLLIEENGPSGIIVARYPANDPNGIPDSTFGSDGSVLINFAPNTDVNAESIALSGDGQIAVGLTINLNPGGNYTFEFGVAVLNGDGLLDGSFNPSNANDASYNAQGLLPGEASVYMGGTAEVNDTSIAFDPSGSVTLVGGGMPLAANTLNQVDIVRLNSAGTLDTSLNNSGTLVTTVTSTQDVQDESGTAVPLIAMAPNGDIVEAFTTNDFDAADQAFGTYVAEFTPSGALDPSFNGGIVNVTEPEFQLSGLAVAPDGDVYLSGGNPAQSGPPTSNLDIISLTSNGLANDSFNGDGYESFNPTTYTGVAYSFAKGIAVEPDGNVVVAGITAIPVLGQPHIYTMQTVVVELMPSGAPDASFNPTGAVPGAEILAPIGESGIPPTGGANVPYELAAEGEFEPNAVAIDPSGNIDLGGEIGGPNDTTIYMSAVRLTPSGALDSTFNPDLPASSTNAQGLPAGAAEVDFGSNFGNAEIAGMAVDSAGDVILVGTVDNNNSGMENVAIGELATGGLADAYFNPSGDNGASPGTDALPLGDDNSQGAGVAIDSSGDIFVAGNSFVFAGNSYVYTANIVEFTGGEPNAALGDSGDLATTFGNTTTDIATGIAIDSQNRAILAGTGYVYGGGDEAVAARYLTTLIGTGVTSANVNASLDGTADLSATVAAAGFDVNSGSITFTVTNADNDVLASVSAPVTNGSASTTIPLAGFNAGTYSIEASYSDSTDTYASSGGSSTLTIAQAAPTVTASAARVTYNASPYANSDVTASVTGLGNVAIADGSFSYSYYDSQGNALSGAPTTAGSYFVVANWSGDTNYTSASSAMTPFTIAQATPNVSAMASGTTFNGTAYPNSDVSVSVTGVSNVLISDGTTTYTYYDSMDDQLSGPPTTAGSYTVVATFSGDTNYTSASSAPAPFTIAQATPTVTASAATINYNGMPYPSSDVTVSVTGLNDSTLTDGTISYTYYDSMGNALSGPPVVAGNYSVVATYSGDTNYASVSSAEAPFTINAAVSVNATVTASAASTVYNGSAYPNSDVTVTVTGADNAPITDGTLTYVYYDSTGNELPNSGAAPANAGSYQVMVIWSGDANYSASASNLAPFTIAKASATVNLGGLAQTYTGSPLSASATTAPSGLAVTFTYNGSPTAPTNAGSYAVVATVSNPNYSGTAGGTLVIAKANLVVTVNSTSRAYGAPNPTFTSTVTGLASGDHITESYSTTATQASLVGSYTITVTLVDPNNRLPNYNVMLHNGALTVTKANLTIAANAQTKVYGSANPTLTGTITGLENGDNITATYSTTASAHSGVGSYPITVTVHDPGSKLMNYNLTVVNSTLTVTQAALTITANNQTKVYGSANPTLTVSYSGFVNGESASSLTAAPTVTTTATLSSNVGQYAITASGAVDPNYSITYVAGALQVTPATLYVMVDPTVSIKLIGKPDPDFVVVYVGFVLGQNSSVLSGTLVITTDLGANSPLGIYAVIASGLTSTNYNIVYVNGYVLEI